MLNSATVHGVLLCINNTGVLLIGESGIGKSELALKLVHAGHALIADDVIALSLENNILIGRCPTLLQDFLEIRSLGVINIPKLFGSTAIKTEQVIDLVIALELPSPNAPTFERITECQTQEILLGLPIPKITLPLMVGQDAAILTLTAVQHFQLKQQGYDAGQDFLHRHQQYMQHS